MTPVKPRCANLEAAGFDGRQAAEDTWEAMLSAGVFVEGNFEFASGLKATLKADAERLYAHPKQLGIILGHFASYPCVQDADALLYVPDGMREFVTLLGRELEKPVVEAVRRPRSSSKYDFDFASPADEERAMSADNLVIGEDVVTTLGSVAGMRKLLTPEQIVHSLAMLLRGMVRPEYQAGLVDHYLLVRKIPTDAVEFQRELKHS